MTPRAKFILEGEDATARAFLLALGNAQKTAKGIESVFKKAFAGISVALVTRAIGGAVGSALAFGDEIDRAATKAGIGGRAMSELAHAAHMSDVELSGLSTGLKFMQKNLDEASRGGKQQIEVLNLLGLQFRDLKNLAADKQFELIADRIYDLKDPLDKTRVATELFGKAGSDLLPLFEEGAEGIRKARIEAVELGKSLSDEQIKALADAEKEVKKLQSAWVGFKNVMVSEVAPGLSEALTAATAKMAGGASLIRYELQVAMENLARAQAAGADEDSLARIEARIREHRAALGLDSATGGRGSKTAQLSPIVVEHQRLGTDKMRAKEAEAAEKEAMERRIASYEESALALQQLHEGELALQEGVNDALKEGNDLIADMGEIAMGEIDAMNDAWLEQSRIMQEEAAERAATIKGIFDEGIFAAAEDGMDGMLKYWADTLKQMGLQAAATEFFNMGGGGVGKVFSSLFGFADGGRPPVGRPSIVGERGPELFVPDGTGTIIPNHKLGGSQVVQNISIDARGSSVESVKLMQQTVPAIIRQAVTQARIAFMDDLSRGVRA